MWFELGHHIVWYINDYKCCGGAFWVCLHGPSDDGSSRSRPNRLCLLQFRSHDPITEKTTIWNLNIYFSYIVSLCYKKVCTRAGQQIALSKPMWYVYIMQCPRLQCAYTIPRSVLSGIIVQNSHSIKYTLQTTNRCHQSISILPISSMCSLLNSRGFEIRDTRIV